MPAIDRDPLERSRKAHSPYRVPMRPGHDASTRTAGDIDPAMVVAAGVLLAASLVRLAPPFAGREAFGTEPTLALLATLGCGWVSLREGFLRLRERLATRALAGTAAIE